MDGKFGIMVQLGECKRSLCIYRFDGKVMDSLELKTSIITRGVNIPFKVFEVFGKTNRISPDPQACNCLLLPDGIIVHLTNVGPMSPFTVDVSDSGKPYLAYNGILVTEVDFPQKSNFYEQVTSNGLPFLGNAVLQGVDVLSFQCLWPCDYAKAGFACQFCHVGGLMEQLAKEKKPFPPFPTPKDVAEIVDYAVNKEKVAKYVQLTGGSTMNPQSECHLVTEMLHAIDDKVGLKNVEGEVLVYTTPPTDPGEIDTVFEAGADRVACDIEVWDEELARQICPGKSRFTGRQRELNTLLYIAEKYGSNKACSAFVIGVEPAESFLAGAEYLASKGIVPIASIWIPHGRPVMGRTEAPGLDYYRKVKEGLALIYEKYHIVPPGRVGFNVCLCRDTWIHRSEIIQKCVHNIPH